MDRAITVIHFVLAYLAGLALMARRPARWLAKMDLLFDPAVPRNPRLDADNPIHQGRLRANGVSNRA